MSDVVVPPPGGAAPEGAPAVAHAEREGLGAWLTTTDHKKIGLMYIGTALVFFLIAVVFAMLMRTQLIRPDMGLLSPEAYNQVFSMHGTTMVFLFGMPMLIGLANYLVPLQIGARDMAFPRANALSYWLLLFGGLLLYSSFLFGGALDTGWFSYAPLTLKAYSPHDGVTFWIVTLVLLGGSSILGSINFIVTCLRFRAPGMKLTQMPIFSIATFINSFLILFAFPSLSAALALLYFDRQYNTSFFDPQGGGDPIIWQHLFWFFGHPEVYILILPAFGIMSEVVPVFSRKPLFGRSSMIVMLGVIGLLGFLVWAHHMFATGLPNFFNAIMAGTSMLIAIPTGVKIFNWLATMWGGSLRFKTPLLYACGLIALFTVGGITGVTLAVVPWDWQVTDTYYVVAHFHNVLIAGTVFAAFAGLYYWFPKMTGRFLSDRLGKVQFWFTAVGFALTFFPMYALGILGMPRRVYTYARRPRLERPQLRLHHRRLHPGRRVPAALLQHHQEPALGREGGREPVGRLDAGVGHQLAAAARQLRAAAAGGQRPPALRRGQRVRGRGRPGRRGGVARRAARAGAAHHHAVLGGVRHPHPRASACSACRWCSSSGSRSSSSRWPCG